MKLFEERHHQPGRIHRAVLHGNKRYRNQYAGKNLESKFRARSQAEIPLVHSFGVVIGESDGSKGQGGKHSNPDEWIGEIGPQQGWNNYGNHDQNASHGGSAGFLLVILWAFFSNVLADLKFTQTIDHERPDDQSGKKGSQAGESGAKRKIAENTERRKIMKEF